MTRLKKARKVLVLGGGPAGLTAAYELARRGVDSAVYEKAATVGGLARSVEYRGYRLDLGGHRYFTKMREVEAIWRDIMGDDLLVRDRLSRIYYKRKFYDYPLKLPNVISNLGLLESGLMLLSYLKAKARPSPREDSFEDYITNRFGSRLYGTFFKSYTEKVWGIPCAQIRSEWAAQRIKGMSFVSVLKAVILGNEDGRIKSMITRFQYPKKGSGQMWERMSERLPDVRTDTEVVGVNLRGDRVESVQVRAGGSTRTVSGDEYISTLPLRELVRMMGDEAPKAVREAAEGLRYRDFITVAMIIGKRDLWRDNWIYVHDNNVRVGRVQNFKNWSPHMTPDPEKTCIGLEYFAFEGDDLWNSPDAELIELGKRELNSIGLLDDPALVEDGVVVRVEKAYPTYDFDYEKNLRTIREYLATIRNLQTIGRNGMHRYNNLDHSMLTAIYAARNILGGKEDVWSVNADQEYHETKKDD